MTTCIPSRRILLKAFLKSFKFNDRRSLNNGVFLSQSLNAMPKIYDDFKGVGKLGVSSFRLNWDYSLLENYNQDKGIEDESKSKVLEKIGERLSSYSYDDLRLASCALWKEGRLLDKKEKEIANQIKDNIAKKLERVLSF